MRCDKILLTVCSGPLLSDIGKARGRGMCPLDIPCALTLTPPHRPGQRRHVQTPFSRRPSRP